jgi:hypothetical protein
MMIGTSLQSKTGSKHFSAKKKGHPYDRKKHIVAFFCSKPLTPTFLCLTPLQLGLEMKSMYSPKKNL